MRRARIKVVTPTYRKAWDSVIPSYQGSFKVFGSVGQKGTFGNWKGGPGEPAQHTFGVRFPGLGACQVEVLFRSVQDQNLEDFVRGDEVTAWWIPEADTQPRDLIQLCLNRAGRYPAPDDRPSGAEPAYAGVFGDANVPDIDTWFYDDLWLGGRRPPHWHLFRQPAGLILQRGAYVENGEAENLDNLRKIHPHYYLQMAADMEKWAIRRFLMCKPGYSRHGEPVHEDFDDELHVAKVEIPVNMREPAIIGVDGGGNTLMPGAVYGQRDYVGRWSVLAEFSPDAATTVDELGTEILRTLNVRFKRARGAVIFIDPAAGVRNPQAPFTYAQQLQHKTGIEVRLAPTNDPQRRRGALKAVLQKTGFFQVDPACSSLIKAYSGGFSYRLADKQKGVLRPIKNQSSHVAEAGEYMVLGGDGQDGFFEGIMSAEGPQDSLSSPQVEM